MTGETEEELLTNAKKHGIAVIQRRSGMKTFQKTKITLEVL
jgi:hypothetical protein